ncbi:MAG: hypothetical protein R3C56_19200 [Pirellulaceae bacterium]
MKVPCGKRPKDRDLRGRKVVVVMAGNPYTESGDRFQIPDNISNRADVYNLGEIIGESAEAFELSYVENCLTSNQYLLARASESLIQRTDPRAAETGSLETRKPRINMSPDQVSECLAVIAKLLKGSRTLCFASIAVTFTRGLPVCLLFCLFSDAYTRPPFKLQRRAIAA